MNYIYQQATAAEEQFHKLHFHPNSNDMKILYIDYGTWSQQIFALPWQQSSHAMCKQGKSEGFDSCDRPSNLTQIEFKSLIFQPMWPWNLMDDPKKQ